MVVSSTEFDFFEKRGEFRLFFLALFISEKHVRKRRKLIYNIAAIDKTSLLVYNNKTKYASTDIDC